MIRLRLPQTLLLSVTLVLLGCQELSTPMAPNEESGVVADGSGSQTNDSGEATGQPPVDGDDQEEAGEETSGDADDVSGTAAAPSSIIAQLRALYNGNPGEAAAIELFEVLVRFVPVGTPQAVQDQALMFIDFVLQSNQGGNLVDPNGSAPPTLQDGLAQLIADVYTLAGVAATPPPPGAFDPDGAAAVVMSGGGQVINGTQFAGADFPAGAFPTPTLVSIVRMPNPVVKGQGPLPTNFPQYPLFYDIKASGPAVQQFLTAICVLDDPPDPLGAPVALVQHLRIAHPDPQNPQTIEILPLAPSPFLSCTGANGGVSTNVPGGLGGLATSFSPFGAVVPGASVFNELRTIIQGLTQPPLSDALIEEVEAVIRFVRNGDTQGAQAQAESVIAQILSARAAGTLLDPNGAAPPTIDEAVTNLVAQLSAFVGLSVTTPPPPPSPSVQEILFVGGGTNSDIMIVESTGANVRSLTSSAGTDLQPMWSPDGSRIVFMRRPPMSRDGDIWVMNADGSAQINVTNSADKEERPAWDPTGTKVVFTRIETSGDARVWTVQADGSGLTAITPAGGDREGFARFSPDGSKIAYLRVASTNMLEVVNADGSNPILLLPSPNGESANLFDWSADGSTLLVDYGSQLKQIVTVRSDGAGGITQLTNFSSATPFVAVFPRWSPDGSKITFGSGEIWVMNADGSAQTMIASGPHNPRWSPDASQIATNSGLGSILVMNSDGSGQQTIPNASGPEWRP